MNGQSVKYISLSEAAKLTNYSQEYISLLCRRKKMKGAKIGRNWATTKEWVEIYINKTKGSGQNIIPVRVEQENRPKDNKKNNLLYRNFNIAFCRRRHSRMSPSEMRANPNLLSRHNDPESFQSTECGIAKSAYGAAIGMPPITGKLILTTIVCSLFVSGFIFLQLGFQNRTKTNPSLAVKGASASIAEGIIFVSDSLDAIKNETAEFTANEIISAGNSLDFIKIESTKFADYKITVAGNALNDIKSKAVSYLKDLNNKKPNPRVAGVEDLNESGGAISDEKNNLINEEKKGMVVVPLEGDKDSPENIDMINRISSSFSDDIDVKPNEDGASGIINPKNNPEEKYLYLMVPVKE